ncbi:MAG: 16S rRNA (guanine(966)-N(2))-methyltransferase RsmD [Candidatus Aminicenantales bacterium]
MLRIIGGLHKGRRLKMLRDARVRPMPAKLKAALFNIIQERLKGADCLDGFAGSGAVGLEAISRGAASVIFLEALPAAAKIIRQNIKRLGAEAQTRILLEEFNRGVIRLAKEKKRFDLIFIDPPYDLLKERNPLKVVKKRGILKRGGIILLRHFDKIQPDLRFFERFRLLRSGDDIISFFREPEEASREEEKGRGKKQKASITSRPIKVG